MVAEIRNAERFDQQAVNDLHRQSSSVWEEDRPALEAHPDALGIAPEAIAEGRVRIAVEESGEPLGFVVVGNHEPGVYELDDLFVEPKAMRQGVGRALVEDAAARALASGGERMTVVAHPRTFPFYESVGFRPGEPERTRFGPAVRMWRPLNEPN